MDKVNTLFDKIEKNPDKLVNLGFTVIKVEEPNCRNTEYSSLNKRRIIKQKFDKDEIFTIKAGKKFNNYQMIQENNIDTDIYETMEKYGSIKPMELNAECVYGDFTQINDILDVYDKQKGAENLFLQLPLEVRKEFNNDPKQFLQKGENYLKNKIQMLKKQNEVISENNSKQMIEKGAE